MAEVKEEAKQEEPKELVPLTEEQKQEEQQIKLWYYRMDRYHITLPSAVKYMAARMAVAYGLDPFLGEMVFIPQYKDRQLVGYQPYVGIGGLRRAARRTGEYGGRKLRPCTEGERKALQVDTEETHAWFCQVWRKGVEHPFDGFGIFPMHDNDKSKAPPWRMARKRAEHAALRAAFDLELQLMEGNGLVVEVEPAKAEDYETGKEVEAIMPEGRPAEEPPPPTSEEAISGAEEVLGEFPPADKKPEEAKEPQGAEGLWAYAEAKGIDIGIVKTVLEETGGEVEETLTRLKKEYGEVE